MSDISTSDDEQRHTNGDDRADGPAWLPHLPQGIVADDVDLLADRSLPGSWTRRWAAAPARDVLFDATTGWVTAAELEERSRRVALRLRAAGLQPGDRLLLSAQASVDLAVAHVAALRASLVVVPVNTGYREREVAHIVRDAQPAAAVVDDGERGGWVRAASTAPVLVTGTDVALPDARTGESLDAVGPDDPGLLVYTSGTTGAPKGAVLTHGNLLASAEAVRLAWRWNPDDRLVLPLPLFHIHGLGVGLHGTLTAGASVVLLRGFDIGETLDALTAHGGTLLFGVPTIYARLAGSARLPELGGLRLCVSGSAPLPPDLFAAVAERGGQRILERYGMTETVMNVSNPYDGERRPGTVGFPLPGVELRLDGGNDEVLLRGANVFPGYWQRPDATTESFTQDGWFRSGDIGRHDADGYLRIVGRLKDLVISGGYNVYPREVEDVLRQHPSVRDVAVVGLPHPEWGEQVAAFVVGDEGDRAALLRFAEGHLASYKRPRQVWYVEDLPRNALGKVVKRELAPPR